MTTENLTKQRRVGLIVTLLLGIHAGLLAYGAYVHSPTYNEPGHLVAGISYWEFGRFDVYSVNPPLVRLVAAAPVLIAGCETDWKSFYEGPGARPEMAMGADFCTANGFRTCWLMTLARWACIPFSLIGGYFVFRWSRELYGTTAGLLSLTLWCFCPNIIAHGQLITSDAAATSLGLVACYTFWKWLQKPTWWKTIGSGVVLGIAELTKTTLVIFYPLWPILWVIYRWPDRKTMTRQQWGREFLMLCTRIAIGLYVINLGYLFEGSGTRLGDFQFVSKSLAGSELTDTGDVKAIYGGNRFEEKWLGKIPMPLPKNYLLGIDLQRRDFESYHNEFYLGGEWSKTGWWYYYLYALAIKVPIGSWLLLFLAGFASYWTNSRVCFRHEFFLLIPGIIILIFVSSQTGMNEHMRYVLPIFPFFYIWIGRVVSRIDVQTLCSRIQPLQLSRKIFNPVALIALSLIWSVGSCLCVYPHSLAYFNEIVGGPSGGARHLLHSNIDWGQDILQLKWWLYKHPEARPFNIIVFGHKSLDYIGVQVLEDVYNELSKDAINNKTYNKLATIPPGWYVLSVNKLYGYGHDNDISKFAGFRSVQPVGFIGYSLYIYNIK